MISCANGRAAKGLMAVCCVSAVACTGEVRRGLPFDEDDSGATIGDAQVARDAARASDADAGTSKSEADARSSSDAANHSGTDAAPRDSGAASGELQDAGTSSHGGDSGALVGPDAAVGGKPVFVVVGYSLGRAYSADLGETWQHEDELVGGGDDTNLLRGVTYAAGQFVAVGHQIWTSSNGRQWVQQENPQSQWLGSATQGLGLYVAIGGYGYSAWSEDAITWHIGTMLDTDACERSAFGNGVFMAACRNGQWWRSTDGKTWIKDTSGSGTNVVWCDDHFANEQGSGSGASGCNKLVPSMKAAYGEGVWLRATDSESLLRSTDGGATWSMPSTPFRVRSVAFAYVP